MLEHDGLPVRADRREPHVARREGGHLLRLCIFPVLRHAPDIGQPVTVAIAHEINKPVVPPHRPRIHSVERREIGKLFRRQIHYRHVRLIRAPIILAPVNLPLAIDRQLLSIRRIRPGDAHIRPRAALHPAVDPDGVQLAHEILAALAGEEYTARIRRPPQHRVVGRMEGELLRLAALGRDDVHVQVARAVARKRDPFSVRRKPRINIPRRVRRQPLQIPAAIVRGPHVAHERKGDASLVIRRIARQLGFAAVCGQGTQQNHGEKYTFHKHTSL